MNVKWYGDKRDLIKWGSLLHLAKDQQIGTIFYVAMLTPHDSSPILTVDNNTHSIDGAVWNHFRCLEDIRRLGDAAGVNIDLHMASFTHQNRSGYFDAVIVRIHDLPSPKIVFLDPDTGLAVQTGTSEHVKPLELVRIWQGLSGGDWLVLYQHSSRSKTWKEDKKRQFQSACGVDQVRVYDGPTVAHDVVFFAATKCHDKR